MLPRQLLRERVGHVLLALGLATTLVCLWTFQQEWDYHSNDPRGAHRPWRHLAGSQGKEFVVVSALLDEIHGQIETKKKNSNDQQMGEMADNEVIADDDMPHLEHAYIRPERAFLTPCPLYPFETLVGRLAGLKDCIAPEELVKNHRKVEDGGRVRPENCTAAEKVAIVIPFRNRYTQLYTLLNNLIPFLQRQLIDARFFVIEQAMATTFNRAALFNIGFLESLEYDNYDCFIFHDVDLIPVNDRNLYRCDEHPVHFAVAMDKFNYELPYKTYFGGVTGFTRDQYLKINGNSNLYFGWGGEDDDLYERIINKNYEVSRPYQNVGRYDMIRHGHDAGNEDNCFRRRLLNTAKERQDVEGLSTVRYKRKYVKVKSHMTWINVYINMSEIVDTAPYYVKRDMELKQSRDKNNSCNFVRGAPIHEQ